MNSKSILLLLFLLIPFLGSTQKEVYESGIKFFDAKQYNKALEYFYSDKFAAENKQLLLRRVICNYEIGQLDNAKKDVGRLLTFEDYPEEIFFWIGRIYHTEGNYVKAAENYKNFLRLNPRTKKRAEVIHLIKQCGKARKLKYLEPQAFVDNFGYPINTEYDEFRMIQSPNYAERFYFSSAREGVNGGKRDEKGKRDDVFGAYNSDMFTTQKENDEWLPIRALNPFLNSSRDELALDFSSDGSILFYMKGSSYENGVIYTDTFSVDKKQILEPRPFKAPIDASKGDVWLHLFNDQTILFASNRPGGYGGYDLYVTYLQDGLWSKPKNLGSGVNSRFDEIAPTISKDGRQLFFSSNREESFGGYDVFKSTFSPQTKSFQSAKNLGQPINSAGNDIGMYLSKDGRSAYLSSDRKQGFGGYDIYTVYFKDQIVGQLNKSAQLAFLKDESFIPSTKNRLLNNKSGNPSSSSTQTKKKRGNETQKIDQSSSSNATQVDNKTNLASSDINVSNPPLEKEIITPEPPAKTIKKTDEKPKSAKTNTSIKKSNTPKKKNRKKKKKSNNKGRISDTKSSSTTEYTLNTLFYSNTNDIITASTEKELNDVVSILKKHQDLNIIIQAHSMEDGMEAVDLYFSVKRAEQIGNYLTNNGIEASRILLKGYGSNYPIAKTESGGSQNDLAEKVNARIEFQFTNLDKYPIKITVLEPYIAEYLRDPRGELFKTVEDGLSYRVQIASVKQMYQNQVLLLYNDGLIEKKQNEDIYRYTLGLYESYVDARNLVKDLENYNVTGAFIVPYIDGKRIPQDQFITYSKFYPDLLKFIENKE